MKHFLILIITALVALTIVFIIYRPDIIEDVWLWVIGLAAPAIGAGKKLINVARVRFKVLVDKHK